MRQRRARTVQQAAEGRDVFEFAGTAGQRTRRRVDAVSRRRRFVADLRRDTYRQLCAWVLLYVRRLCRVQHREPLRTHGGRLLALGAGCGAGGRGAGRAGRSGGSAPHLPGARAVSSARHVCASADLSRRRALAVGPGRPVRTACAASGGRGRFPRPSAAHLRHRVDRDRTRGVAAALVRVDAHALGHAGACRHAGSRDARCARHQSGVAVYRGVFRRRVSRRVGRRAARAAHVGESVAGSGDDRQCVRGGSGRRHGFDSGCVHRRAAHRGDQGAVHRHRPCDDLRRRPVVEPLYARG